ncbi:hypothetical protein ARHIZOSPH14_00030 [Agromyces rhizosphaerae]|uniref:DNA-binding protein n=1 Tax=Agromyces rhizosphaerae TaxID=88374 RepID=A0A9W6CTF0_9MICO|nr:DNA-binding protein [Agromyces rhizosphaerae]GLI25761.1 hypothetical protein ARHIZOSPH14_00030 [Agromyces rhizosphaerae]
MFVITADQVGSRTRDDIVDETRQRIDAAHGDALALPVGRNAGDELQALTGDAATALALVLELTRDERWSVGLGTGAVRMPLPDDVREASGPAFYAARDAVDRAKRRWPKVAVTSGADAAETAASDAEALLSVVVALREKRSDAGWELAELLDTGMLQADAAERLDISPAAVSARARAGALRPDLEARPALTRLLQELDRTASGDDEETT